MRREVNICFLKLSTRFPIHSRDLSDQATGTTAAGAGKALKGALGVGRAKGAGSNEEDSPGKHYEVRRWWFVCLFVGLDRCLERNVKVNI
jgi:hypothetical protein